MTLTLNIAALTRRTGVPADTIRKWEQRYGVLHPERTSGGQRRYSELDVARVEWLKARLAEGFRIGEAAALLGSTDVAGTTPNDLRAAIVDATARIDIGALRSAIGQALLLDSLEVTFASVLGPALVEIGERWESGDLSVAQEHLASGAIRASLLRLLADPRPSVRGVAVLACAPGEWHELGLLMLAILLRADGWQVAYLGPNTPVADAVALADGLRASEVMFSATRDEALEAVRAGLEAIHVPDGIDVVVGGSATDRRAAVETVAALR